MTNTPKPTPVAADEATQEEPMTWLLKPAGYKPGDKPPVPAQDNTPAPVLPSVK